MSKPVTLATGTTKDPVCGMAVNPATATANGNSYDGINNLLSGGFGYVNWFNGAGANPRSGQLIARFQF